MKIKSIKTYRLHNHDHFLFMTEVKHTITSVEANFPVIEDLYNKFSELYNKENALLENNGSMRTSLAKKIEESDNKRDDYHRGIELIIKGYQRHIDKDMKDAANTLMKVFSKYGDLRPMPYEEETIAIDNLCEEMENYLSDLEKLHLTEWIKMLKEENNIFKYYMDEVNREFIDISSNNYLKLLRRKIDQVYENLKFRIEALSLTDSHTTFKPLVDNLNNIIDNFFPKYRYTGKDYPKNDDSQEDYNYNNVIPECYY